MKDRECGVLSFIDIFIIFVNSLTRLLYLYEINYFLTSCLFYFQMKSLFPKISQKILTKKNL